jgi:hypothetical protein
MNKTTFTGETFMGEIVTIECGDLVLIEGVEWVITDICDDGTFFADSNDGDWDHFEIDDIG